MKTQTRVTRKAVTEAAKVFDWVSIEERLRTKCECAEEGDSGEVLYDPQTNPCPGCKEEVERLLVRAAPHMKVSS